MAGLYNPPMSPDEAFAELLGAITRDTQHAP